MQVWSVFDIRKGNYMKFLRNCAITLIIFVVSISCAGAQYLLPPKTFYPVESDGTVKLPQEKRIAPAYIAQNKSADSWTKFEKKYGDWTAYFDKYSGKPLAAFGKPIQIPGYSAVDETNAVEAALDFVRETGGIFGIDAGALRFVGKSNVGSLWSVGFVQTYEGADVLLSEVRVMVRADGKVSSFNIDYYDDIDVETTPKIPHSAANANAAIGLDIQNKNEVKLQSGGTYILPIKTKSGVEYKFVYETDVNTGVINSDYTSYMDAHSGALVWRRLQTLNEASEVRSKGTVRLRNPLSPLTEVHFPHQFIRVDGFNKSTDDQGVLHEDIDETVPIQGSFAGKFAKVVNYEGSESELADSLSPGEIKDMTWDDTNSDLFERHLFYHTNVAHDYYKSIDPTSTAMDFQLQVMFTNQGYSPNASSDLNTGNITFWKVNDARIKFVESPSVLYHEYGHSVNSRFYREMGVSTGMINYATHEATADIYAASILDDSKVGRYYSPADTTKFIRDVNNNRKYPQHINGESHNDGMVLGGALWDVRKRVSLDYISNIVHLTKKIGLPDDEILEVAFGEWFMQILIADDAYGDGNNDLSDGTPHAVEIIESFNKHNIGTSLMLLNSFAHDELPDTDDTEHAYVVEFELDIDMEFINAQEEDVKLVYSTDNFNTEMEVDATQYEPGKYRAEIPPMPNGTRVAYYVKATESYSGSEITFSTEIDNFKPFDFLVGYKLSYLEDFGDEPEGWSTDAQGDDVTGNGAWEWGDPDELALNYGGNKYHIQPGDDHSPDNDYCFVTGAEVNEGTTEGVYGNMPNGRTTLTSPVIDISELENPLVRYYNWFTNIPMFSGRYSNWIVHVSSNCGGKWVQVENVTEYEFAWQMKEIFVEEYVAKTDSFQIRFIVDAKTGSGVYPGAMSEGLVDDMMIFSGNDFKITSVENQAATKRGEATIYPNPFSREATVEFVLDAPAEVELSLVDATGATVFKTEPRNYGAGAARVSIPAEGLSQGMYIYVLRAGGEIMSGRAAIVK